MYSEGVLFLELIKEMEHLRAIDLLLSEHSLFNCIYIYIQLFFYKNHFNEQIY